MYFSCKFLIPFRIHRELPPPWGKAANGGGGRRPRAPQEEEVRQRGVARKETRACAGTLLRGHLKDPLKWNSHSIACKLISQELLKVPFKNFYLYVCSRRATDLQSGKRPGEISQVKMFNPNLQKTCHTT